MRDRLIGWVKSRCFCAWVSGDVENLFGSGYVGGVVAFSVEVPGVEASRVRDAGVDVTTLEHIVTLYTGDFAPDLTAEWTEAPREALRRDVLDAISSLVRILRTADPEQAPALLTTTLAEIDARPSPETLSLYDALQRPGRPDDAQTEKRPADSAELLKFIRSRAARPQ